MKQYSGSCEDCVYYEHREGAWGLCSIIMPPVLAERLGFDSQYDVPQADTRYDYSCSLIELKEV